jgi:hypothetical protein
VLAIASFILDTEAILASELVAFGRCSIHISVCIEVLYFSDVCNRTGFVAFYMWILIAAHGFGAISISAWRISCFACVPHVAALREVIIASELNTASVLIATFRCTICLIRLWLKAYTTTMEICCTILRDTASRLVAATFSTDLVEGDLLTCTTSLIIVIAASFACRKIIHTRTKVLSQYFTLRIVFIFRFTVL